MQRRHELAEPKTYTQDMYIVQLIGKILSDGSSLAKVIKAFKAHHEKVANKMNGVTLKRAVSGIAAKRLVKKVLLLRRHHVGALLRATRSINKLVKMILARGCTLFTENPTTMRLHTHLHLGPLH